eukprot:augustus_masked-scaffold_1-processed-gene-19.9-mRNA-1 protein AED:1.00 eAED:1.00 QI:0/0/0/0/1/1/2/0/319
MSLPQRSCLTSTSTEGLECASRRERRLLVVSVNVGGLTTTKLNLLEEKTQQLSILMLQELHESGYKMLTERVKVSSSKGKWFFSKPPTGAAGVATYLAEELASNVPTVQSTSDRILKVVLQGTGKKKINVVNCYAPHCGLGRESYREFLKELSVVTRNLNKRRTLLLGGDFNAQVSRTTLKKEGKLGFSKRSNANGKLLENWLKIKGYSIVNHGHVTGKKGAKNMEHSIPDMIIRRYRKSTSSSPTNQKGFTCSDQDETSKIPKRQEKMGKNAPERPLLASLEQTTCTTARPQDYSGAPKLKRGRKRLRSLDADCSKVD